ncbi:ankyrin repeat-containing domain protein, partial [Ochromonadaceae sp. CCMP2298]
MAQYSEAGVNERDPDFGLTPFHYACRGVKLSMVSYLQSMCADIHMTTPDGRTALHLAAAYSTKEIVLYLLGECVSFEAEDNFGCTAL